MPGARIYERSPAVEITKGSVRTVRGTIRADVVIRATEAFTPTLPGLKRAIVPVYSLMIATEPLPDAFWQEAGLHQRETFTDARRLVIYGQRTADGRFAFGGRGAPYHLGSRMRPQYDEDPGVFAALQRTLRSLFPKLGDAEVTHRWGGAVGIPRDWYSSVGFDRATGMGWAGGYVGDGVSTTNLAGRTLADLVLGRDTDITHLPWVEPRVAAVGARTAALDRHQRRARPRDVPRPRRSQGQEPAPPRQVRAPVSSAADAISRSSASAGAHVPGARCSALRSGARSSAWSAPGRCWCGSRRGPFPRRRSGRDRDRW